MMRKFHTQFDQKNLTGNAGLVHLGRFAQKLGLDDILSRTIDIKRGDNAQYQVAEIVMMLMFGVLAGAKHISHLAILGCDSVITTLFKWDRFPFATTFSRVFKLLVVPTKQCGSINSMGYMLYS